MTDYERIERVLAHLTTHYLEQPSLAELARIAGLSEFHFQRLFTRWAGTTPKSFLQYLTARHAKELLRQSRDLLSTALDAGLSGPGRLHDLMVNLEGVTPGQFKSKGTGLEIRHGFHETPFGSCLVGLTERGVCHLAFVGTQRRAAVAELMEQWPNARFESEERATGAVIGRIFSESGRGRVSLLLKGTPFQLKVWEALLRIPEGHVLSYADVAGLIGSPRAARAVGTAVGQNSLAYLIPCHRVIRESGIIGDYRWGTERKRAVLAWESSRRSGRKK